jgi:hypothetical protein
MEIKQGLCSNALRKVGLLITKASELGMDLDGFGEIAENQSNGNVYLWNDDDSFTLFIDLGSDTIWACWYNFYNGEEEIIDSTNMTLYQIEEWANNLTHEAEKNNRVLTQSQS